MTAESAPRSRSARVLSKLSRLVLGLAIFGFLVARLVRDWPTIAPTLSGLRWAWVAVSAVLGGLYFLLRGYAWQQILRSMGATAPLRSTFRVWMNGEIARYIPGNVWSVVGRVAQAPALGLNRSLVFSSMVLEALLLVAAATGLSAVLLVPYPAAHFSGRTFLLVAVAAASLLVVSGRLASRVAGFVYRLLRKSERLPAVARLGNAYVGMVAAWAAFACFSVATAAALGIGVGGAFLGLAGVFIASWLIGYLSFITPSGIGIREAVLVFLLAPFMTAPQAILIAVFSRVVSVVVELLVLLAANVIRKNPSSSFAKT